MPADFLVAETTSEEDGAGRVLAVGALGPRVLLTLGIQHVLEQQSLQVAVHGSDDGTDWNRGSLFEFPQKFYPGLWSAVIDMERTPDVRFLRAQWKVNRWGRGSQVASFRWYVFAETL